MLTSEAFPLPIISVLSARTYAHGNPNPDISTEKCERSSARIWCLYLWHTLLQKRYSSWISDFITAAFVRLQ